MAQNLPTVQEKIKTEISEAGLPEKQQQAILALLASPSIREAAAAAQVSVRTLYRWLADDPHFKSCYLTARSNFMEHTVAHLQQSSWEAVEVLRHIANDKLASTASRVAACRSLLAFSLRGTELWDLQLRIKALEEADELDETDNPWRLEKG